MRRSGRIQGIVQGVGFRPYAARLAAELALSGRVRNEGRGVRIEVEGEAPAVGAFEARIAATPPPARVESAIWEDVPEEGEPGFRIEESEAGGPARWSIPPDLAPCADCLAEVDAAAARRHAYPFTSCARCGPRYTLALGLPWDRERSTMAGFPMCWECAREYGDPRDRRHHAQPIACPRCGPGLRLESGDGAPLASGGEALEGAVAAVRRGDVLALKGLGGFQLVVDARHEGAVGRLRRRKGREEKPFAVLVPDLAAARALASLDATEEAALASPAAPIVLARSRGVGLAPGVAPGNARIGVMLPASPLHHLLARRLGFPVVCTSGNLHGDPIAQDDAEVRRRLPGVADAVLTHERPIARRCDDAVVHVVDGVPRTLRLGRGLGPVLLPAPWAGDPVVAVGGHMQVAPVAAADGEVLLWPHVGDLDGLVAREALGKAVEALLGVVGRRATVARDAHPDYGSTRLAESLGLSHVSVYHHHAHVAACLAEHGEEEALGVAWDGVGLGPDGSAWGGEFLEVTPRGAARVAWLRPFPLPGGDGTARDGRRCLAGVAAVAGIPGADPRLLALARSPLAVPTTSAGRLFDAVAALLGVRERSTFSGQAAMALEHAATGAGEAYPFGFDGRILDWAPAVRAAAGEGDPGVASARFHATLAAMVAAVAAARRARVVALTGGCFQNARLVGETAAALRRLGIRVLLPARVPPGDGGLALGQAWVASRWLGGGSDAPRGDGGGSPSPSE